MKIIKYFIVGGIAALIDISFFFVFAKLFKFNYLAIATIGFIIATFANYILSINHVFQSSIRFGKQHEVMLVFIVSGIGLLINQLILVIMISMLSTEMLLSKICATASVFIWNFSVRHFYIFKHPNA